MKLVLEDAQGAYQSVTETFLHAFSLIETDPNFDVFESYDGTNRAILVKTARVPSDDDLEAGRFGIDFNRGKPLLEEALAYHDRLAVSTALTTRLAFSAGSEEEYRRKAGVWESLFSYVFDTKPCTVWFSPHSGGISPRIASGLLIPESVIDGGSAGVAAMCAREYPGDTGKRNLIAIHTTGFLEAVINLGDFGVLDESAMLSVIPGIEKKYGDRIQFLSDRFFFGLHRQLDELSSGYHVTKWIVTSGAFH